jgi:hypothetical protein
MEKSFKSFRMFWEGDPDPKLDLDPDPKVKKEEPTYTKADIEKAAQRRQAALKRARKAEDDLKAYKAKQKDMPDPDEFDSLQTNYDKLQQQVKDLKEKQADEDLKKIEDEKERARVKMEREFDKERAKLAKQMEDMNKQIDSFSTEKEQHQKTLDKWRRSSLENDIITSANKAYNPGQIVKLIGEDFEYDEQDDRWYKHVYDAKGKLTNVLSVREYVDTFLADKDNENLLKADIKRGSDMPRGSRQDNRQDEGPPADQTPTAPMYKWAEMSGLDVNEKSTTEEKTWLFNTYTRLHSKQVKPS